MCGEEVGGGRRWEEKKNKLTQYNNKQNEKKPKKNPQKIENKLV